MKTLIYGAGTLGCLYAQRLFAAGHDVTILARGEQRDFLHEHGVVLVNEFTKQRETAKVDVVDGLAEEDAYDLVLVLIRKNLLEPVFESLARCRHLSHILFMGNNVLGFDAYLERVPREKVLFGFPGAGGSRRQGVIHYVDSEVPNGRRIPVTIGELDGEDRARTREIAALFERSGVPVDVTADIDGWLKYHAALVSPMAHALLLHDADNYALAEDREGLRTFVRACKEGGRVLRALGYTKRQPFKWNLFYWLPERITAAMFGKLLGSPFAEIAYARHVKAARDEMACLAEEFRTLIERSSVSTPNIDRLRDAV